MAKKIEPLRAAHFGLGQHSYQVHNATVPSGTKPKDLEEPAFWAHVKTKVRIHDEIRVVAEDSTFFAKVLVTAQDSLSILTKVIYSVDLDPIDEDSMSAGQTRYFAKLRGTLKWCIVDREDDSNVLKGIGSRALAEAELEQYVRALAA